MTLVKLTNWDLVKPSWKKLGHFILVEAPETFTVHLEIALAYHDGSIHSAHQPIFNGRR